MSKVPDPRAETGVMKFGEDWSGIFIRGDNALGYVQVLKSLVQTKLAPVDSIQLQDLIQLLESCVEWSGDQYQWLKSYEECVADHTEYKPDPGYHL